MASERVQRRIERLIDQIEAAADQRDWQLVLRLSEDVLAVDPANSDAAVYVGAAKRNLDPASSPPQYSTASNPTAQPTTEQPTSFANGRYEVRRFLGEGGKKKVYLAQDTLLDREVAFAIIKTEGLNEVSRTRIEREARVMGRLGSHQHIVTVFDLGEHESQPYMVTELMGGGDVEGLIEKAAQHRLALEQAIRIAQETCRGLEFAHSCGIVHRDLKPGNVWLTEDGAAKIGDFGLALALDHSRLTGEGLMVGTVSYMPPEQAMGGDVTPRSDLYSLGAMLYEMITGRPPFLGDDSVAIIGQHINTPPVAPVWHNGQCPRALDALVLRLLAKDPSERPESATDVLSALSAIDLSEVPTLNSADGEISDPYSLDSLAGGVFVGRQRELGDLKACLENALSGRGRLVTLVGEPGIGKTRTAQELATYAGLRGAQVLWGRCYEEQGMPPYWPWVQAIRSYVRERDPDQLRSEMGAGAADIAEVVSDVKERLPDLKPPPALDSPEQARFRLFDSITSFLKTASQKQPLVLVLDDLHWADQPSLMLLQFVARELEHSRLLLVGTYRDMELSRLHPLADTLGELTRERLFQRVLLRGLTLQDVGRFIEVAAGVDPPSGLTEAVHTQTEGNPLFVTEVVRLLVQEGELPRESGTRDSWTVRIPEGVREVIGRRLNRLSRRCNETLTIASVIGREFELRQLVPLVEEVSEDRLLEVLEEALAARVIEELPQSVGRYQFTHALIQETLTEELTLTRKVRLHARIAEALEELYGGDAESHAAELAHHFSEGEAVMGTEKLIRYSLLAGERAFAARAYEEALAHFQRGLTAKGVQSGPTEPPPGSVQGIDADTAAILYGLGRAQASLLSPSEWPEPLSNLTRAFDFYFESGDVDRAVAIAENPLFGGFGSGASQVGTRALSLVQPDSHAAGRLLSHYGITIYHDTANYEGARDAFARAGAIARREGDTALEAEALGNGAHVDADECHWEEALEKCLQAVELFPQIDSTDAGWFGRRAAVDALWAMGHFEEAKTHLEAGLAAAEGLGRNNRRLAGARSLHLAAAYHTANWEAVRTLSDDSEDARSYGYRAWMEYEVGDFAQGEVYLGRMVETMRRVSPGPTNPFSITALVIGEVSRITGDTNWLKVSQEAAGIVLSSPFAIPRFAMPAKIALGLLALGRGDAVAAAEQYAALETASGTFLLSLDLGSVDRRLGLFSQAMGELDQAATHFEQGLAFCRKTAYRPELAWTCCDYADTLLQRNEPGDHEKAISLLDESLAISTELGMRPLMERVVDLVEGVQSRPSPAPVYPDNLTRREVEVLCLVARGKSNREIAGELVISVSTVVHHMSNILSKTGAANRADAAMYAARKGLVAL